MCGIVGVAQHDGRAFQYARRDVMRMCDAIVHRGPDDSGVYDGGQVILGMRRLSIIDLSGGHQPIANEDSTVWVVCNGEIYNFRQLRKSLEACGHRFSTHSDTEVLVHLYEEHGESFVEHLEGMFGFALWDARQGKLLVCRDRLGIKPVYLWRRGSGLAFASEVKSILALDGASAAIDEAALRDHLAIGYAVAPRTIFHGIEKLPPATLLVWQHGRTEMRRYWAPPESTDESRGFDEWVEVVRAELRRAVSEHLVSDVPLGAFLSGGVDSSAVAALMREHGSGELNTYSVGYVGDATADYYNETPFAARMARQLESNHREIEVQPDVARLLPKLMWHLEEPISDSAIVTTYLVSELAAKSVKVILSGVGGDELFAGYNRYLGGHYSRQYRLIPQWARRGLMPLIARALPSGRQNLMMDIARYAKRFINASELSWKEQYKYFVALADDRRLVDLGVAGPDGLDGVLASENSQDELLRLLRVDWQSQLSEDLLLLTDKMTMACSIECRVPFLDHRLVETAASIPARHKLNGGGELKSVLKHALRGVLPDSVIDRRKRGFGAPVGAWFKRDLAPLRARLLSRRAVMDRGLLDYEAVAGICDAHDAAREDYTDILLVLMNLEIWCRLFLDGRSHDDVAQELAEPSLAA